MKVGVIGAGQIGGAIAEMLARSGKYTVTASRRKTGELENLLKLGVHVTGKNMDVVRSSDLIFLAVKPYKATEVINEISEYLPGKILISVAAAVPIKKLLDAAPGARLVRAMPNIALLVKSSFTAYASGPGITGDDEVNIEKLLKEMGECMKVEEELLNAVTALSGSGPAYVATLLEAMAYAGLKVGLPRELAYLSSAWTVLGTAKLHLQNGVHPAAIKEMVLTPAGTTIEGIFYLEESGIRTAVMKAVEAATVRGREIEQKLDKK